AVVRCRLRASTGVRWLLPLGTEHRPLRRSVRSSARCLVLCPDNLARPAASLFAAVAVRAFSLFGAGGDGGATQPGTGVPAAGVRLVSVLLLAVGLQAADVYITGVSAAGPCPG